MGWLNWMMIVEGRGWFFLFFFYIFYGCVSWICFISAICAVDTPILWMGKTKLNVLWFMHHVFYASVNLL